MTMLFTAQDVRFRDCLSEIVSYQVHCSSCLQVLAIHRAIHTRPLPTSVSLPGGDALVAKVKSYDGSSVARMLNVPSPYRQAIQAPPFRAAFTTLR